MSQYCTLPCMSEHLLSEYHKHLHRFTSVLYKTAYKRKWKTCAIARGASMTMWRQAGIPMYACAVKIQQNNNKTPLLLRIACRPIRSMRTMWKMERKIAAFFQVHLKLMENRLIHMSLVSFVIFSRSKESAQLFTPMRFLVGLIRWLNIIKNRRMG